MWIFPVKYKEPPPHKAGAAKALPFLGAGRGAVVLCTPEVPPGGGQGQRGCTLTEHPRERRSRKAQA